MRVGLPSLAKACDSHVESDEQQPQLPQQPSMILVL